MSHTDLIDKLPEGFKSIAHTKDCPVAAMENTEKKVNIQILLWIYLKKN